MPSPMSVNRNGVADVDVVDVDVDVDDDYVDDVDYVDCKQATLLVDDAFLSN